MGFGGFYLLVLGQGITWCGLGVSLYLQWENRAALRELQWLGETSTPPRGFEPLASERLNRVASGGGGDPDPARTWDSEYHTRPKGGSPGVVHSLDDKSLGLGFTSILLGFGWLLFFITGIWWLVGQRISTRDGAEESVSSPSERQRAIAQRQLAEVRLRKHGFTQ